MQYPEPSTYGTFHNKSRADWTDKDFDEWGVWRNDLYAYWSWLSKRRFHALPEDKGIPVPGTGSSRWHSGKNSGKTGVIGSSRMLPHRYMDEGDKGKSHNRHIKRLERRLWLQDWLDEGYDHEDAVTVGEWFSRSSEWWEVDDSEDWEPRDCGNRYCEICYPLDF